jgi:hypothetical protein
MTCGYPAVTIARLVRLQVRDHADAVSDFRRLTGWMALLARSAAAKC